MEKNMNELLIGLFFILWTFIVSKYWQIVIKKMIKDGEIILKK
jgi:hypothetical protein